MQEKDQNHVRSYIANKKTPLIGWLCYYLMPYRKQVILANMRLVFANVLENKQIKKLCCLFYAHLIRSIIESIKIRFLNKASIDACGEIANPQYAEQVLAKGKGAILLTGHFGSWEFGTLACCSRFPQTELFVIRKNIRSKWIEKILFSNFNKFNLNILRKNQHTLLKSYRLLKQNKALVVAFDQHADLGKNRGILVDFFDHPCATSTNIAALAQRTGAVVIPTYLQRQEDGKHILSLEHPLQWQVNEDKQAEIYQNTKRYNESLEKMLLHRPEQWLWSHKRWRKDAYADQMIDQQQAEKTS